MITRRHFVQSALLLPVVPALLARTVQAQDTPRIATPSPNAPWLEQIAAQLQGEFNLPAVWMAANSEDKVEAAVVGVRKFGDATPATLDDLLTVGSISKTMAGLWLATLVEKGKLSYDSKALDVLPELKAGCLPEHQDITLKQLLTHTAALVKGSRTMRDHLSLAEYPAERIRQAKDVLAQPSPPGSQDESLYSNSGVTLAATMGERVAGETYEAAATRFFREQLGLSSWGVWPMNLKDDLTYPWPHQMRNNIPVPRPPSVIQNHYSRPSGNAHCTITDLVRYGLLATNATDDAKTILKPETWNFILQTPPNVDTTYGSFSVSPNRSTFSHNGSMVIDQSSLFVYSRRRTAIAVHTNATVDDLARFRTHGIGRLADIIRQQRGGRRTIPR